MTAVEACCELQCPDPASFEKWRCNDALSWALVIERAALRAITTRSLSSSCDRWLRKLSRISRLSRFRSTARLACFLEIARPKRARPVSLLTANTVNQRSAERRGPSNTRLKSAADRRRAERGNRRSEICQALSVRIRGQDERGLWRAGHSRLCGHFGSPCGRENRGYVRA